MPLSGKTSRLCTEIFELSLIHSLSFPDPFPVAAFIPPLTEWAFSRLFCKVVEDASLDGYSDGRIRKTGVNSFVISVSPFQSKERRNFVIAHELGHLFLHMGFKTNSTRWKAQNDTACYHNENLKVEYQANEFAVAFLMPQQDYELVLRQNIKQNMVDTSTIAEYFCVTIETAAIRGKRLGYLRW